MVIKEDGSKWACQSCLKGHRVSGCSHTDRPLQFVPKKGRPVTQCQHCRVERKRRSAHVKCECGEKSHSKEKCIHLRNAEAALGEPGRELVPVPEREESADQTCCCSHGEKCVCFTVKKTPEHGHELQPPQARPKPRLTTTQSEGHLTVFANGHHKPIHRNNNAAHDANMPYRVHKPHATHATHAAHAAHGLHAAGRRSVDSLVSTDRVVKLSMEQIQQLAAESAPSSIAADTQTSTEMTFGAFAIPADAMAPSGTDDLFELQPDSIFQSAAPQSAMSDASGDFNWNAFDWSTLGGMENTQPALTYASSNTISEFGGDHTPPDESGSGFNLQANSNTLSTQAAEVAGRLAFAPPNAQSESQQNRWSMPPSFWADPNNNSYVNLLTAFDAGAADEKTISLNGHEDPFSNLDMNAQTTSATGQDRPMLPSHLGSFDPAAFTTRDIKEQSWKQGPVSSSMQFTTPVTAASDMIEFGYVDDNDVSPGLSYQQDQPDSFFGLDSADAIAFRQDFITNDIRDTW